MLHELASAGSDREIWWLHSTREPEPQAFANEVGQLLQRLPRAHAHTYYTSEHASITTSATASRGRLTPHGLADLHLPPDATAYLCGPDSFMSAMGEALVQLGFNRRAVHTEQFGALAAINPGITDGVRPRPHQPPGPAGTGPRVTFTRSGLTVCWSSTFGSVLELAEASDVPTRYSCRTGVCHTCVTPVVSGEVAYDPEPLEPPDRGEVLICCSHPEDDLVLDL
jgi:ferredoxin